MISPEIYKLVHLIGLALICYALGGFSLRSEDQSARRRFSMFHGIGLLISLVGGFGMLARYKISALESGIIFKLIVWAALGGSIVIFKRKPELTKPVSVVLALLMVGAAYTGVFLRAS